VGLDPVDREPGQKVDVFYVQLSQKAKLDQDDNMPERYDVPVKLQADPSYDATVV
jgi:hypothetical protein